MKVGYEEYEHIRVDMKSMQAALLKAKLMIIDIEENRAHIDLIHTAYKLNQFLRDALGEKTVSRLMGVSRLVEDTDKDGG